MRTPDWHDPLPYVRAHAAKVMLGGGTIQPTAVLFEGEQPTVYLRSRPLMPGQNRDSLMAEMVGYLSRLGAARALLWSGGRLWGPEEEEPPEDEVDPTRDVEYIVLVGWASRDGGELQRDGVVLRYGMDDGGNVEWRDEIPVPEAGPLAGYLDIITDGPGIAASMTVADLTYALSRWGHVIGVAAGWRSTYGMDQPLDPAKVRPVDRRRASHYRKAHRLTTRKAGR